MHAHQIDRCWQQLAPALAADIIALWQREQAIGEAGEAARRVGESVCVARDADGQLAGVATAQPRLIPFLGETLYYVRAFLAPQARRGMLGLRLLAATQRILAEDAASPAPSSPAIGLFLELENPVFQRERDWAIWPRTGFIYAGRTPRGLQRRIWYFPDARLRDTTTA